MYFKLTALFFFAVLISDLDFLSSTFYKKHFYIYASNMKGPLFLMRLWMCSIL